MRVVIADPSLSTETGHHYNLTKRISEAFSGLGHRVIWATHVDFMNVPRESPFEIMGAFNHTMYDRYDPKTKTTLPGDLDRILAKEILDLCRKMELGSDDILYFHTGYGDLYRAYVRHIAAIKNYVWPITHICTPYDLETMPAQDKDDPLDAVFNDLVSLPVINSDLFLWTETDLLSQHLNQLFKPVFARLELPPQLSALAAPLNAFDIANERILVSYLGAAREEKGFHLIPSLVEIVSRSKFQDKVHFYIQCTPQKIGYNAVISEALSKLRQFPTELVTLEDQPLHDDVYYRVLAQTDLMLLLYSTQTYRIRGSGIAVEAICAGVPILTFDNTFCSHLLTRKLCNIVGLDGRADQALMRSLDDLAELKVEAARLKEEFLARSSTEKYARLLITAHLARRARLQLLPSA